MNLDGELAVTYENGALRPDHNLGLPEGTRLVIAIRRVEVTPESERRGRAVIHDLRDRGHIRLAGWRATRDELHERD